MSNEPWAASNWGDVLAVLVSERRLMFKEAIDAVNDKHKTSRALAAFERFKDKYLDGVGRVRLAFVHPIVYARYASAKTDLMMNRSVDQVTPITVNGFIIDKFKLEQLFFKDQLDARQAHISKEGLKYGIVFGSLIPLTMALLNLKYSNFEYLQAISPYLIFNSLLVSIFGYVYGAFGAINRVHQVNE